MPKKKPKKRSTGKKKKGKKKIAPQPPLLFAEVGMKTRQYLDLQVNDQRDAIERLQAKLNNVQADYNALLETGGAAAKQLGDDRDFHAHESSRLKQQLVQQIDKAASAAATLQAEINRLSNELTAAEDRRVMEVEALNEHITALTQKLDGLEHFRKEEAAIKAQLEDAELQLGSLEATHQAEIEKIQRKAAEKEAYLYKESEQKLARVARAFREEAAGNIDKRSNQALASSKILQEKVDALNKKLFGVIAANKSVKDKAESIRRDLEIESDLKEQYAKKYRKSQKVISKLRDSLNTEKARTDALEVEKAKLEAEHNESEIAYERHLEVLQATIRATGEDLRSHEEITSRKGLPDANVARFGEMMDWVMSQIETKFVKQAQKLGGGDGRAKELADLHTKYKAVLKRLRDWGTEAANREVQDRNIGHAADPKETTFTGVSIANVRSVGVGTDRAPWVALSSKNTSSSSHFRSETSLRPKTPSRRRATARSDIPSASQDAGALSPTSLQAALHSRMETSSNGTREGWAERVSTVPRSSGREYDLDVNRVVVHGFQDLAISPV